MDFLTKLAEALRSLGLLHEDILKQTDAISQATEAARERQQDPLPIPLPVTAELQIPEADKREQQRQHNDNHALQIWLVIGTWLAFIAAAVYAGVTSCQLKEMKRATENAKDAFVIDERATVVVTNVRWYSNGRICSIPDGKDHICVELDLINGGKSPALDTHLVTHVITPAIASNRQSARDEIEQFASKSSSEESNIEPMSVGEHKWLGASKEEVCETGNCIPLQVATKMTTDGETPFYVYGRVRYRDIFECEHATRFCFNRLIKCTNSIPDGCLYPCDFGNGMNDPDIKLSPKCKQH